MELAQQIMSLQFRKMINIVAIQVVAKREYWKQENEFPKNGKTKKTYSSH